MQGIKVEDFEREKKRKKWGEAEERGVERKRKEVGRKGKGGQMADGVSVV